MKLKIVHIPITLKKYFLEQERVQISKHEDREGNQAWALVPPDDHNHPFSNLIYDTLFATTERIKTIKKKTKNIVAQYRYPGNDENDDMEFCGDKGIEDEEEKVYHY